MCLFWLVWRLKFGRGCLYINNRVRIFVTLTVGVACIWYQWVQWVYSSDFFRLVMCMKFWFVLFWLYYLVACFLLKSDYCLIICVIIILWDAWERNKFLFCDEIAGNGDVEPCSNIGKFPFRGCASLKPRPASPLHRPCLAHIEHTTSPNIAQHHTCLT